MATLAPAVGPHHWLRGGLPEAARPRAVQLGDLRRLTPVDARFGYGRGLPIDRYYIEGYLARHASAIRGRVLEVKNNAYTRRFGADRVSQSDILDVGVGNPAATVIADLSKATRIGADSFDCFIMTQTLQFIYDKEAAVATVHRILKPGGVVLATVPGIIQMEGASGPDGASYWSFTARSVERLFRGAFGSRVGVEVYGNVLAAVGFLYGLATEDLNRAELDYYDPGYPVTIAVRAEKAVASPSCDGTTL